MADITLRAAALTARDFDPFGEVIETAGHTARWINDGSCERFDDLARVDVLAEGGRPLISIFRALPQALPFRVRILERHPLSSQAFIPLNGLPFLVIVAAAGDMPVVQRLRAFRSSGAQGVSYRRNTWHHPLVALERSSDFLVVDRGGAGENCEQAPIGDDVILVSVPAA